MHKSYTLGTVKLSSATTESAPLYLHLYNNRSEAIAIIRFIEVLEGVLIAYLPFVRDLKEAHSRSNVNIAGIL